MVVLFGYSLLVLGHRYAGHTVHDKGGLATIVFLCYPTTPPHHQSLQSYDVPPGVTAPAIVSLAPVILAERLLTCSSRFYLLSPRSWTCRRFHLHSADR